MPAIYETTTNEGTLYVIVEPAEIGNRRNRFNDVEILPQARLTTGTEYDARDRGITPTTLKIRGREYTTDYIMSTHYERGATDAANPDWFAKTRGFHVVHRAYGGGHRHAKTGQPLSGETLANHVLSALLYETMAWLDEVHPQWRAQSTRLAYAHMIQRERTEITNAQQRITEAQARIAELTKKMEEVK